MLAHCCGCKIHSLPLPASPIVGGVAEGSIQTPEARKLGLAGGWAHSGGNGRATTSAEGAVSLMLPSSMSMLLSVAFVIPVLRCNLGLRLRQVNPRIGISVAKMNSSCAVGTLA